MLLAMHLHNRKSARTKTTAVLVNLISHKQLYRNKVVFKAASLLQRWGVCKQWTGLPTGLLDWTTGLIFDLKFIPSAQKGKIVKEKHSVTVCVGRRESGED